MKTFLLILIAFAANTCLAQQQDLLHHSIVGSETCTDQGPCYNRIMNHVPVQRFFLDLAKSPMGVSQANAALEGTGVKAEDLLALRLIRSEGTRYALNFPLFTAADVNLIRARSEGYGDSLAQAILARRSDLGGVLASYDAPGVDRKAVAYFLLGCVSLDWDGLDITAEHKYRATAGKRPDGDYVPAAEEETAQSLKGIYWGSHNSRFGGIGFTSFGDHFSRRFTFPDLVWGLPARLTKSGDPEGADKAFQALLSASLQDSVAHAGQMMLTLRDGEKTPEEVATAAKLPPEDVKSILRALAGLDYVTETNGRYRANVPVLTERDRALSDRVRRIGREVQEQWLSQNYPQIKADMKALSFTRSGVPFEDGFTMIWHYIFGITNRKLVEAGFFADPYAPERKFKGSIPVVYSLEY